MQVKKADKAQRALASGALFSYGFLTKKEAEEPAAYAPKAGEAAAPVIGGSAEGARVTVCGGILTINIKEGKGIHIELPV